jgi:hypothetical protein
MAEDQGAISVESWQSTSMKETIDQGPAEAGRRAQAII